MEKLIKAARAFYGIALAGLGAEQLYFGDFLPVIFPPWAHIPGLAIWAYIFGALLIIAGIAVTFGIAVDKISIIAALVFFALFLFSHVPYEIFVDPYSKHLGVWTNALKELALSGGAFIIAASFPLTSGSSKMAIFTLGRIFFSVMLICFGIDHFLYPDFVSPLVPAWIPQHTFFTYFSGVALIGSGVAIFLNIKIKLVALLLGVMLLLWLIVLHIPRAIAEPVANKGNELASVFEALGFSGIAFVIGFRKSKKDKVFR